MSRGSEAQFSAFSTHHDASKEWNSFCCIILRTVGKRLCNICNYFVKVQTTGLNDSEKNLHDPLQIFLKSQKDINYQFKFYVL